ncbi:MAG: alpha/beta hydrolase [Cyclobacteriaceae bacterium]
MSGDYHLLKSKKGILGYKKVGHGNQVLLAFHGFGQDHTAFDPIVRELEKRFIIYSFDLFFHGGSEWHGNEPISKQEWATIISQFVNQENLSKFSLLGFSLGAKFALVILEAFEGAVESIYFISPDGIKRNIWYNLATRFPGRWFFKSLIKRPKRFHGILSLAQQLKLVDDSVIRFARSQMETERQRGKVYNSWVMFSKLQVSLPHIASIMKNQSIQTVLIVGTRDKLITAKDMKKLIAMNNQIKLEVVEAGHTNVIAKSAEVVKKIK